MQSRSAAPSGGGEGAYVLCCPDKFRGALEAHEAARALARGIRAGGLAAREHPLADGGEGTLDVVLRARPARLVHRQVPDALGAPVEGRIALFPDRSAMVELAEVAGLQRLAPEARDVMGASSAGVGMLVGAALDAGAERVIVALGGSATVDGGLGALRALGARLLAAGGEELHGRGRDLPRLERIDIAGLDPRLRGRLELAADVSTPLHGPGGAAAMFGPQKGATPSEVAMLDAGLRRLEALLGLRGPERLGAAGGFAAPFVAFCGARVRSGAALVRELTGFDRALEASFACLTGEGRIDAQSSHGKTVAGVAEAASRQGVPVFAVGGAVEDGAADLYRLGVSGIFGIARRPLGLQEALASTRANLEWTARAIAGALKLALGGPSV